MTQKLLRGSRLLLTNIVKYLNINIIEITKTDNYVYINRNTAYRIKTVGTEIMLNLATLLIFSVGTIDYPSVLELSKLFKYLNESL